MLIVAAAGGRGELCSAAQLDAVFSRAGGGRSSRPGDVGNRRAAGGCFWCTAMFPEHVKGVTRAVSGYAGELGPRATRGLVVAAVTPSQSR